MGDDDGLQLIAANGYALLFMVAATIMLAPCITDPVLFYGLVLFYAVLLSYMVLALIWAVV